MELGHALRVALAAAREAGDLLRADLHRPGGPRGKIDKAEADVEAEALIRSRLSAAFPDWGYLGEETGRIEGAPGAPIWLVDPNDGTRDYLKGRRGSAVSIALLHERRPVLGVVFAFSYPDDEGDLFSWAEGSGLVRRNGRAVAPPLPAVLTANDVVVVSSGGARSPGLNLECSTPARFRPVPSIAHRLALAAAGEAAAAVSVHAPGAWDYAAGHALIRGAGAVLVDEEGREITYNADGTSNVRRAFAGSEPVARELARRSWERTRDHAEPTSEVFPLRSELGKVVADPGLLSRAQGCLLGQVVGDSLGSLVEFASAAEIHARHGDGPRLLADGGCWSTIAGQPTDDSEMAFALARAIVARGDYDAAAAFEAYRAWHATSPFDLGRTTEAALLGHPLPDSQANGSLMRVCPLGILAHARPAAQAAEWARADAALTHPHVVCRDATAAYVVALAHAVGHGTGPVACYEAALRWCHEAGAAAPVIEALERAVVEAPACEGESQGLVLVALQNAFYELLHASSFEAGVVTTVQRGGDTDTNAAVAGALLGAVHGRSATPMQWRQMVQSCHTHAAAAKRPRPPAYWPADVLEVAERLAWLGGAPRT
jgi:ADP-ribosylglycohydrolase/fructose-1,6-bisphosphatase/inositol monophosphatase family enzyme